MTTAVLLKGPELRGVEGTRLQPTFSNHLTTEEWRGNPPPNCLHRVAITTLKPTTGKDDSYQGAAIKTKV